MVCDIVVWIILCIQIVFFIFAIAVADKKSVPTILPLPHHYQTYIAYKSREITVDGIAVPVRERVDDVLTDYYWADENFNNIGKLEIRNIVYRLQRPIQVKNEVEICDYLDFGDNKKTTFKGYVSDDGMSIIKY